MRCEGVAKPCAGYHVHPANKAVSRDEPVIVMQPSEHRAALDDGCWYEVLRQGSGAESGRAALVDSLVRSCPVEVRTVLSEDALQMALAEQRDVVQAFSAKRTHKSLDEGVCCGRKDRRADDADTSAVGDVVEGPGELAIVIAEQKPRAVAERSPNTSHLCPITRAETSLRPRVG